MKTKKQTVKIPSLVFHSDFFKCPKCGWQYPGPLLIKGDIAPTTRCKNCNHSYLVRVK